MLSRKVVEGGASCHQAKAAVKIRRNQITSKPRYLETKILGNQDQMTSIDPATTTMATAGSVRLFDIMGYFLIN
jgi:hypothetical protein